MPIVGDDRQFDPTWLLQFKAAAIFGANHWRSLPAGGQLLCWDKSLGKGAADSFVDGEFAWTSVRTKRNVIRWLWKGICTTKTGEYNGRRWHPTQKPVAVMGQLVDLMPAHLPIADPYCGSGPTLLACVRRRRPAIGVEIDPRHFDTACRRVEAEVKAVEAGQPWAKLCDVASFPAKPLP